MSQNPNILFIITHDTGRHLGCYGRGVETPNLDWLAAQGVTFDNAFCSAPQCSPSRGSILSGQMPHVSGLIGLTHRGFRLNADCPRLPRILADAGYATWLFGLEHEDPSPANLGYANVRAGKGKGNSCANVTPLVLEFLKSKPTQPFFASVGVTETHRPFPHSDAPLENIKPLPYLPDIPETRRDVANLEVLVRRVDDSVGKILDALAETGLLHNTIIIYTTDHGIAFPRSKATLFDPGLETALIIRLPEGYPAGQRVCAPVCNIDLLPSLLDYLQIPAPPGVQGRSMVPLISGERTSLHEELYFEMTFHAAYDPMRAVRTERYKYIRSFEKRPFAFPPNVDAGLSKEVTKELGWYDRPRPPEQLYDLQTDPNEMDNLAGKPEHAHTLAELRAKLNKWMEDTDDPIRKGPVPCPEGAKVTPPESYDP
ncbi:MAG TPA: sulfatase [Candidatus Brocadiia bacterium]|nr:sulfatase [Candidatus Brocadiia bacterium]